MIRPASCWSNAGSMPLSWAEVDVVGYSGARERLMPAPRKLLGIQARKVYARRAG